MAWKSACWIAVDFQVCSFFTTIGRKKSPLRGGGSACQTIKKESWKSRLEILDDVHRRDYLVDRVQVEHVPPEP